MMPGSLPSLRRKSLLRSRGVGDSTQTRMGRTLQQHFKGVAFWDDFLVCDPTPYAVSQCVCQSVAFLYLAPVVLFAHWLRPGTLKII